MTAVIIITLLLASALAVLTAFSRRMSPKTSLIINGALTAAGLISLVVLRIVFGVVNTSEYAAQAESNFSFFLKISLTLECILLFLTLVPTLMLFVEDRQSAYSGFLRKVFPAVSSVVLLMTATLAYPLTSHITSYIAPLIYCVGISEAFIMRLPYVLSDIKRLLTGSGKPAKNKNDRGSSRRKGSK